ncbi:MAG: hypothetical protein KUG70_08375 [Rhodobacteraceae bacterium]|nr:hypothetical protein [Paracoccaceae bacterium]
MTSRILFVCLGNICRSPAAQGCLAGMWALRPGGAETPLHQFRDSAPQQATSQVPDQNHN